jgi:hypothetical protein
MYRFLVAAVASLLLGGVGGGCHGKSQPAPPGRTDRTDALVKVPPVSPPWQQPMEVLGESLSQGREQYQRNHRLDADKLQRALDDLGANLPGQPARSGLARARRALERGQIDPALQAIDEAMASLPDWEAYWPAASQARPLLEAAREDLQAAEPARAGVELEQAEALLVSAELEVPWRGLQAALREVASESHPQPSPPESSGKGDRTLQRLRKAEEQWVALRDTLLLLEVLRHVNLAHQRFLELAKAGTQAELEQAGQALAKLQEARPSLEEAIQGLKDDMEGIQKDLGKGAAGVEDRLTALWKKLKSLLRELGRRHVSEEKSLASSSPREP